MVAFSLAITFFNANISSTKAFGDKTEYVADFSNGKPDDWTYYAYGDNAYATPITKSGNGITLANSYTDANAGTKANYYGTVYRVANSLNNVSDFTLEMSYRVKATVENDQTRWVGLMYHVNTNMGGKISGMMMNYRYNGKSAASKVGTGPSFDDFNVVESTGYSHNGATFLTLKIVVEGDTATHYVNNQQITTYTISDYTSEKSGGFALIVNKSEIEISSFKISGVCSELTKIYSADFESDKTSVVEEYSKCETNNSSVYSYNEGGISGIGITHSGTSQTTNNYYGSMFKFNDLALQNVGDFELTLKCRVKNPQLENRWFGIAFHTQYDVNDLMSGYMLVYRNNGSMHPTTISTTSGVPSFTDDTTQIVDTGYVHNGTTYYTVGIMVSGGYVETYIEGGASVGGTWPAFYSLQARESILGGQNKSGGFAIIANRCTVEICSMTVEISSSSETPAKGANVTSTLKYAPTTAMVVDEQADFTALNSMQRSPDHLIFNTNDNLNVIDKNGNELYSLGEALRKTSARSLPIVKISSTTAQNKFIKFLELENIYDIGVMSANESILKAIRTSSSGQNIRAIYDWTSTKISTTEDLRQVVWTTNSSRAHVAMVSLEDMNQENVRYIQSRLKTVWVMMDGEDRFTATKAITTGAYGVVGTDLTNTFSAFSLFSENDYNQLRAPVNVAHRGLCHEYAEGSDIAYKKAVEQGATTLEVDVHLTKDKQLVLMHNATIDATTNGSGTVVDMTLAQIQQYKCDVLSTNYNQQIADTSKWGKIWSVDEMFNEFKDNPNVVYAFEWKTNDPYAVEVLKTLLDKYDNYHQIFVITFNDNMIQKMRDYLPQIPTASLNYKQLWRSNLKYLQQNNTYCDTDKYGDSSYAEMGKHRGYMPFYWTFYTQEQIDNAVKNGCFGITNNRANSISHYPVSLSAKAEDYHVISASSLKTNGYQAYFTAYDGSKTNVSAKVFEIKEYQGYCEAIITANFTTTKTSKTQITDSYSGGYTYALYSNPIRFIDPSVYMSVSEINNLLNSQAESFTVEDIATIEKAKVAYELLSESDKSTIDISKADVLIDEINEIYGAHVVSVSGENVSVSGVNSGSEYDYGTNLNIVITADTGYELTSVILDGVEVSITDNKQLTLPLTVKKAHSVVIVANLSKHLITISGNNITTNGLANGGEYTYGESANITINALSQYRITSITINGVNQTITNEKSFSYSVLITEDHDIVITTEIIKYTVTINGNNFTLNGITSSSEHVVNQTVNGVITAIYGYKITAVEIDGVSQSLTSQSQYQLQLTVSKNHVINVVVEKIMHTVTVVGENIEISGFVSGNSYSLNYVINGEIKPNYGYKIVAVSIDGTPQVVANESIFMVAFSVSQNHVIEVSTQAITRSVVVEGANLVITGFTSGGQYGLGTIVNGAITPTAGYKITIVYVDGTPQVITNENQFSVSLTITKNHVISVGTELKSFALTFSGDNYRLEGFEETSDLHFDDLVEGIIYAEEGYELTSVLIDGVEQLTDNEQYLEVQFRVSKNHVIEIVAEDINQSQSNSNSGPSSSTIEPAGCPSKIGGANVCVIAITFASAMLIIHKKKSK